MKQQIRLKALDQVRQGVSEQHVADDTHADIYHEVEAIINELEHGPGMTKLDALAGRSAPVGGRPGLCT